MQGKIFWGHVVGDEGQGGASFSVRVNEGDAEYEVSVDIPAGTVLRLAKKAVRNVGARATDANIKAKVALKREPTPFAAGKYTFVWDRTLGGYRPTGARKRVYRDHQPYPVVVVDGEVLVDRHNVFKTREDAEAWVAEAGGPANLTPKERADVGLGLRGVEVFS